MSRRRNRGRRPAAAQPQQPQIPQPSSPVVLNSSASTIDDMWVLLELDAAAGDENALYALTPRLLGFLDRIIVGGIRQRPASEFWLLVYEVKRQLSEQQGN